MPSAEEIANMFTQLVRDRGPEIELMREATSLYNYDVLLPIPGKTKDERATVANLTKKATDQYARRTTSTLPSILVPPIREGSKRSDDRAKKESDVLHGWWYKNRYKSRLRRRARWFFAYGAAPVLIRPPTSKEQKLMGDVWVPIAEECNPLGFFYPLPSSQSDITPPYGIRAAKRPWRWLEQNYPDAAKLVKPAGRDPKPHDLFEVLAYVDDEELHSVVLGPAEPSRGWPPESTRAVASLARSDNLAGLCTFVVPQRLTLDRNMGAVDASIMGRFLEAGKLSALEVMAIFDQIVANEWVFSTDTVKPDIVQEPQPAEGIRGIIKGGQPFRQGIDPTVLVANNPVDRATGTMRHDLEVPSQWGGENPTNVRTGAAGDMLIGATTDFAIQEDQETLAHSAEEEFRRMVKVAKGWKGSTPQKFFVGWPGVKDQVSYTPNADLYTEDVHVAWALPGMDADSASVRLGNAMALRLLSRQTARRLHPDVEDNEFEERQTLVESLDEGMLAELSQPGALPVHLRARIKTLVLEQGLSLDAAIVKVQEEAQQEQAAQAQAPPGSPQSQPGLGGGELVNPEQAGPIDELGRLFFSQRSAQRSPTP